MVEPLRGLGMHVPTQTKEQFSASLKSEAELWSEVIRRGRIVGE